MRKLDMVFVQILDRLPTLVLRSIVLGFVLAMASIFALLSPVYALGKAPVPEPPPEPTIDIQQIWNTLTNQSSARELASSDPNQYAWDAFLALNWPSQGKGSDVPNFGSNIGDPGFVVWEGWKSENEVYLANGARPQPWATFDEPPAAVIELAKSQGLCSSSDCADDAFHNMRLIEQVDALTFKSNKDNNNEPIRYEIGMNESMFNCIYTNELYNINGQEAIAQGTAEFQQCNPDATGTVAWGDGPIDFNWDAMEVKAAWIWLDPSNPQADDIKDRYVTAIGYYQKFNDDGTPELVDGEPVYAVSEAALSGLHVISKALVGWVWTTFENQYNADYTTSTIELGIPEPVQALNRQVQSQLGDSKYANYQLVGAQTGFYEPEKLANSQIESAFQNRSSCFTCHFISNISTQTSGQLRYSFVDNRGGNLTYFIGELPEQTIEDLKAGYMPMDYVWSLNLAKRDRSGS